MHRSKLYFLIITILFVTSAINSQSKTRIAQTETVEFPHNGKVEIEVIETLDKPMKLVFTNSKAKKKIAEFILKNNDSYIPYQFESVTNPITRFRVLENIENLPSPLVQAVAVNPGGSDHAFWTILLAEIDGKIKMLTPKTTENSIQGGIHIGNLGTENGTGLAVYNYIWADDEAHYDKHRYKVDLYKFDEAKQMFAKTKTLISKEKYAKKSDALEELGFGFFENRLNDFEEIRVFREDDNEFPETNSADVELKPAAAAIIEKKTRPANSVETEEILPGNLSGRSKNPVEMTAEDYFREGKKHQGNWFEARKFFDQAIALKPDFAEAYFERGKVTIGDAEQIKDFLKVTQLKPNFAPAFYHLGLIYFLTDLAESFKYYTKTVELDPGNFEAYIALGNIHRLNGKMDAAIENYTKAVEINPDDRTFYIRGQAFLEMNKNSEAVADLTKSAELRKDYYWTYINRAKAYRQLGKLKLAVADETKAAEIGRPR